MKEERGRKREGRERVRGIKWEGKDEWRRREMREEGRVKRRIVAPR